MIKSVVLLSLLIFYTLVNANTSIADWAQIGDTTFFDPSTIEYTKRDTIFIWLKDTLNKTDIYRFQMKANDFYKQFDKHLDHTLSGYIDYSYHNYSDYSYSIQQFEYDCNNRFIRLIIEYDYDKYNRVINRTYDLESVFTYVLPSSKNEYKLNEVCNYAKNTEDEKIPYQQRRLMPEVMPSPKKGSGLWSTNPDQQTIPAPLQGLDNEKGK